MEDSQTLIRLPKPVSRPVLPQLTGIRFYAALLVFFTHIPHLPGMDWLWDKHFILFRLGDLGVTLFFVLSGFILTYNYAPSFDENISTEKYFRFTWNRFTRIYPVHLLALFISIPLQILSPNRPLDWGALPFHLSLTQCMLPFADPPYYVYLNIPSWSISCEWFFYLLAPLAIYATASKRGRWVGGISFILYAALVLLLLNKITAESNSEYFYCFFAPTRFIDFVCGIALAYFFSLKKGQTQRNCNLFEAVGILLLCAAAVARPSAPSVLRGGLLFVPGAVMLLYALACGDGLFARHLRQPLLIKLGCASFAFYLLHLPVIRTAKGALVFLHREISSPGAMIGATLVVFLIAQFAALLTFKFYEVPMQSRLRSLLNGRRFPGWDFLNLKAGL